MRVGLERSGTVEGFFGLIDRLAAADGVASILVLTATGNGFTPADLDAGLRRLSHPVFGGVFPGLIHGREKLDRGTVALGLPSSPTILLVEGLSDPEITYDRIIEAAPWPDLDGGTMFVFADGLAERIEPLIHGLFNIFGLEVDYLGGGCGSLDFRQAPCILSNRGLLQDCAVLALSDLTGGIGVCHGWESIAGPLRVTRSDRNRVLHIEGRSAFDVYREVVEAHSGRDFGEEGFYEIASHYPFGILRLEAERIIRDPFEAREDGSLVCVGEIPPQAFVDIMVGHEPALIKAAGSALAMARRSYQADEPPGTTLFLDCISRMLFLEERFQEELEAVQEESLDLLGALTIGEIANSGRDYLELYNKTSVVGVFPR